MWHKWIAVVLITASVAAAQGSSNEETAQPVSAIGNDNQISAPLAGSQQYYNKLRRGHDEQILIWPVRLTEDCFAGNSTEPTYYPKAIYFNPRSLQLEPIAGLTVSYGNGEKFASDAVPSATWTNNGWAIFLRLRAAGDIPVGDYVIRGKMNFFRLVKEGCPTEQDIMIPVTVVDRGNKARRNDWPEEIRPQYPPNEKLQTFLAFLLLPFTFMWGLIVCGSPSCE